MTVTAEAPAQTAGAPKDDSPIDYSAFEAAVAQISADDATNVDSPSMVEARRVYGDLTPKSKRAAKAWLKGLTEKTVINEDWNESKRLVLINNNAAKSTTVNTGTGTSRKSPTEKAIETFQTIHLAYQVAAQRLAALGIDPAKSVPDEVDVTPAVEYANWINNPESGDEPEVDNKFKRAARVSLGRGPGGQGRKPGSKAKESDNELPDAETVAAIDGDDDE